MSLCNKLFDAFDSRRLKWLPNLKTLIIVDNPCTHHGEAEESHRVLVISCLPNLERLDKKKVTDEEREKGRQLNRIFGDEDDRWVYSPCCGEEGEEEIEVESPDGRPPTATTK